MTSIDDLRRLASEQQFSGVVRLETNGEVVGQFACGMADRRNEIANALTTRFAVASATKGLTALTVMSLVESDELALGTTARGILGSTLPLVDEAVTIEHLLGHTSGVGDYLDEEALGDIDEHVLTVSAHLLETPSDYVELLSPHAQVSRPGDRFVYNNSGYIILSMVIEHVMGSFHAAVADRVLAPAGIVDGGFFRTDALPPDTAVGYLEDGRSNVFHLPVVGGGDGGIYLSLDDVSSFWNALFDGRIVSPAMVEQMTTIANTTSSGEAYGLGFWLGDQGASVLLEGMDAGVSFRSAYNRSTGESYTLISNTSSGVWPLARLLVDDNSAS